MKSKNKKIQILMKGMAIVLVMMFVLTPTAFATSSLDDSNLEGSFLDKILYGTIGSTVKEIEEYFSEEGRTTLYITNEKQLRAFAEYVNQGNSCEGKKIVLLNNIIVDSTQEWVPIGKIDTPFKGSFDGRGYTISGVNFNRNNKLYSEISYVGLFGYASNATIKNITLANSKFNIPYDVESDILHSSDDVDLFTGINFNSRYSHLGGIVGGNYLGTIENCHINEDVFISGMQAVGGIAGNNSRGTIINCSNNGIILGFTGVGGISGGNYGDISSYNSGNSTIIDFRNDSSAMIINCENNESASIYGLIGAVGGIVGGNNGNAIIQKSVNYGSVKISTELIDINVEGEIVSYDPQNVGGIAGFVTGGVYQGNKGYAAADGCINFGEVQGYRDVGGIVGQLGTLGGGYVIMSNCINYSLDVIAMITNNNVGEVGYLAGEAGSSGSDADDRSDDSIAILYNNFYVLDESILKNITAPEEFKLATDDTQANPQYKNDLTDPTNLEYARRAFYCDAELNNVSHESDYTLGYGWLYSYDTDDNNYTDVNNTTSIILKTNSDDYYAILDRSYGATQYYAKKLNNSDYFFSGPYKFQFIATENSGGSNFDLKRDSLKIKIDNSINAFKIEENIWVLNNSNEEYIFDSSTGTTVSYTISKKEAGQNSYNTVDESAYFKAGDEIRIVATFNKALCSAWIPKTGITSGMDLTLNSSIEATSTEYSINTSGDTSQITYIYKITEDTENVRIETLNLKKTGTIYVSNGDTYKTITGTKNISTDVTSKGLYIDTIAPIINTKIYVENALETGRYTVGKEVIIEARTNEAVQDTSTPAIQVSFSESGIGRYNYDNTTDTVGYAKCKDAKINVDGSVTWIYSYQIQEGDEGEIGVAYASGELVDLAGNTTDLTQYKQVSVPGADTTGSLTSTITGTNVANSSNRDTKTLTYRFYTGTGSDKTLITNATYITNTDTLTIEVDIPGFVYSNYYNGTTGNTAVLLTTTTAPSLTIDGKTATASNVSHNKSISSSVVQGDYEDVITTITYTITGDIFGYSNVTQLEDMVLKPSTSLYVSNRYAKRFATEGEGTEELYDIGQMNEVTTVLTSSNSSSVDISGLSIYIDPIGIAKTFEVEDIYADTTSPTVEITIKDEDAIIDTITNKDILTYEFKWSEEVEGFTKDDIKVTNGTVETFEGPDENNIYTATIKTTVSAGNMGDMEVVIEQDACRDLVGYSNVRTAKTITIDKQAPTVEITANKDYVQVGEVITYTFNWSEAVKDFDETKITVNNAEMVTEETAQTNTDTTTPEGEETEEEKPKVKFTKVNDAQYTLEVMPTNGNDVEVIVADNQCTDIAGNYNIGSKHIIQVIPTLTISTDTTNPTNQAQITYTFTWSEEVIGFTAEDIIVNNQATKGELSAVTENENGTYSYTMTVDYENVIPNGNEGEVSIYVPETAVTDTNGNGNAYTSNITRIDRIAPILISLEAFATSDIKVDETVDSVKENYKVGDTVTVVATFSENIENTETVPVLALQFSDSGNAKGTVTEGVKEGNKITYTYTITAGDMGTLSVKGFSGKVIDSAGNETVVTRRALDGDTIIADTEDPVLEGITVIAPDFEYDNLLSDPGDTKRYGTTSKTRDNNTITFITTYSEAIYYLNTDTVQAIDDTNQPTLTFKFGTGTERTATFSKVEGNQIYYTYNISSGDNGDLDNIKINGKVADKAGNELTLTAASKEPDLYEDAITEENKVDKITADTTKPTFAISATAEDKDDDGNKITGNGSYYRKGSIITITATTSEYVYQNSNKNLEKFTIATAPELKVSFETSGTGTGNCTNVEYKDNQTIFTYTYTIKENDNGRLNLSIDALQGYDIALNGNDKEPQSVSNIVADTIRPYYEDQPGIEYNSNKYQVTFNENLYYLDENNQVRPFGDTTKAPLLKFEGEETEYKPTISGNVISYSGKYINAKPYLGASRLCDRAGNLYAYYDQQAPTLSSSGIRVTSPATGTYKAGEKITIVATFNEKVTGTAPTLRLKFGETSAKGTVSGGIIQDNTITYTYTITDGDNGVLGIESYTGTGLTDEDGNVWVVPENVTLGGSRITADTIPPTVVITSNVKTTNQDTVIYTFTWSENVYGFTADDIEITNGLKGTFSGSGKVYTLEVDTTGEGRQIVKVNANVCEDIAGNLNKERATYNNVVIDYTKPEIRAKVNGGYYVIDTDKETSTLKEIIVVNEEVSKFEYVWSNSDTIPTEGYTEINPDEIQINSDIKLETQVEETGTYYMYIKITDLAGNTSIGKTNGFIVNESEITLTPNTTEMTKEDVVVTVEYGDGLTQERKAGVQGKTQSADSTTVIVSENGTVYAEAADIAGNKVYTTLEITNIDKTEPEEPDDPDTPPVEEDTTPPEITFNYTTTTATVGTTIGATITTNEDAIISYSWDNQNWTSSSDYVRSQRVVRTPTQAGTYTLYARATDKASNTSSVSTLQFTIVDSEEDIVSPEVIFEDLTTIQKDGIKYVKVSPTYTTTMLTDKMDQDALVGKIPVYENLTSNNGLKTGTEIKIDGETKYIVIVNGDVNCDGNVTFLDDIILINNYRIGVVTNLTDIQILAGDINNSGTIEFIPDIVAMNNYRLERINVL